MNTDKKLTNIFLKEGITDKLNGKTISNVAYSKSCDDYDLNYLVITFTDGTYINIVIERDDDGEPYLENGSVIPLTSYSPTSIGYVINNKFCYYKNFQNLIDIGVVEPLNEEETLKSIRERKKFVEINEYNNYLRLKEKYENYNPLENNEDPDTIND